MRKIGWIFGLVWVCFACNKAMSEEGQTAGENSLTTGSISGIISYKDDKKTLPDAGATVYVVSTTKPNPTATPDDKFKNRYFQAVTDPNGNYTFPNLPPDTYTLVFVSQHAPRKLTYYKTRYSAVLEPLINEMPVAALNGKQAKEARLNQLFEEQQVHAKPDVKLTGGATQILTQEFIKH